MPSKSLNFFNRYTVKEVRSMTTIFRERNANPGPNTNYGLLHGGLILLVSGWETYCEEVSREAAKEIIREDKKIPFSLLPDSVKNAIIQYAYIENLGNKNPLETNLVRLPDDGWKKLFIETIDEYLRDFNTPKFNRSSGKNLKNLFKKLLSANIEQEISDLTGVPDMAADIDKIISIRGDISHRGTPDQKDRFDANGLLSNLKTIQRCCAALDCIIHREFGERYGFKPWQMTKTIWQHLPGYNATSGVKPSTFSDMSENFLTQRLI